MSRIQIALAVALAAAAGCAAPSAATGRTLLSEDEVIHLITHPREWDERTVSVRVWPYDNGFSESYVLCFERCDADYAERSPFILYTARGRFEGYAGDRPVVITARYSGTCFYRDSHLCVHTRYGRFYEVPPG